MKLLTKNDIQQKKSLERRLEIEEGAKLARKVDTLRETAASEEAKLSAFREQSIQAIHEELEPLQTQRDALRLEVDKLVQQRAELQKPLDAEWEKLRFQQSELQARAEDLDALDARLEEKRLEVNEKLVAVDIEQSKIESVKSELKNRSDATASKLKEAEQYLQAAKQKDLEAARHLDSVVKDLTSREAIVATRERDVEIKREQIIKDRRELQAHERQIKDKYQTLERAKSR